MKALKSPTKLLLSRDNSFVIDSVHSHQEEQEQPNELRQFVNADVSEGGFQHYTKAVPIKYFDFKKDIENSKRAINKDIMMREKMFCSARSILNSAGSDLDASPNPSKRIEADDSSPISALGHWSGEVRKRQLTQQATHKKSTRKLMPSSSEVAIAFGSRAALIMQVQEDWKPMAQYKTVAQITLEDGVLYKGKVSVDADRICVETDSPAAITLEFPAAYLKKYELRRNTFVLKFSEDGEVQVLVRLTPPKIPIFTKHLVSIMKANQARELEQQAPSSLKGLGQASLGESVVNEEAEADDTSECNVDDFSQEESCGDA